MNSDGAVRRSAPAKLNLYLHVVGRRADGYHLLDSLVAFPRLGDRIAAAPAAELSLAVAGPFAQALAGVGENLVLTAARRLAAATGCREGARLRLYKALPVAAGLGGGSADAAATLQALLALWRVGIDAAELGRLALSLGADVPACMAGHPVQLAGIGEILTPAPGLPPAWVVLANPGIALATPEVFRRFGGAKLSEPAPLTEVPASAVALAAALQRRRNDLEPAACALAPAVGTVLTALAGLPGCLLARMSGSGATCFGLFASAAEADAGAALLQAAHDRWWVAAARLTG